MGRMTKPVAKELRVQILTKMCSLAAKQRHASVAHSPTFASPTPSAPPKKHHKK